jgi:hypothetical protein
MKLRFTRQELLDAVEYEHLRAGQFVQFPDRAEIGDCNVCWIGAALRARQFTNTDIHAWAATLTDGQFARGDPIKWALKSENYLGAASIFFEETWWRREAQFGEAAFKKAIDEGWLLREIRNELKAWVVEHVPETFEVDGSMLPSRLQKPPTRTP